jgi:zinc transporter ZupT
VHTEAEIEAMHVEAKTFYEASTTACLPESAMVAGDSFACARLNLTETQFESNFVLDFPSEHAEDDKLFQFMTFFMGPKAFEWGGVFSFADKELLKWRMQKVNGAYARSSMRLVIIPTDAPTEATMHTSEKTGHRLMGGDSCSEIGDGESMTPAAGGSCFELHVGTGDESSFTIDTTGLTGFVIFAQHFPTQFENTKHYLKDEFGNDQNPLFQEPDPSEEDPHAGHDHGRFLAEDEHAGHDHGGGASFESVDFSTIFQVKNANSGAALTPVSSSTSNVIPPHDDSFPQDKNLGLPIIASLVVNLVTLTGVIFLIPGVKSILTTAKVTDEKYAAADKESNSLEAGTANMTKMPADFNMEGDMVMLTSAFSAGAILSCAFLLVLPEAFVFIQVTADGGLFWKNGTSVLAGLLFPFLLSTVGAVLYPSSAKNSTPMRITFGVLVGDFFHNFADGCFIGVAFMNCDTSFGWTVAISSILHEIAQEVADFFTLTSLAGLPPWKALTLNFISGFSVMIGAIVVISFGMSDNTLGYILAVGGGIYIQIGAAECLPRAFDNAISQGQKIKSMFMFAFGAILIGLVLMDHEHCEVGGGHEGHNH